MEGARDYSESVTLIAQGEDDGRTMSLAEAVRTIMAMEPQLRCLTGIVRAGHPILNADEIKVIYARPNFPKASG